MKLLKYISAVSAMAHCPFLSSVSPDFFGPDSFTELPGIKDVAAIFEGPAYTKWRSLRESEDSRNLGLTAPRFLLRHPYAPDENPVKSFNYHENVSKTTNTICGVTPRFCWQQTWLRVSCQRAGARILSVHKVVVL